MSNQRFSLTRFSLQDAGAGGEIQLSMSVAEQLNGTSKCSVIVVINGLFAENLRGSAQFTIGLYEQMQVAENLSANITGGINVNLGTIVSEEALRSNINLAANIQLNHAMEDSLDCNAWLSNNMQIGLQASDALWSKFVLTASIPTSAVLTEALNCDIAVVNLTREVVLLNVTIPAGGRLVIDTDFYTATLNDENVIDLHSGDWPWLTRDLVELDIDSGTGGALTGKVIYTERYL